MNLLLAVMLSWIPPMEREDGNLLLLSEIEGYRLYISYKDYITDIPAVTFPGATTQYDLGGVPDGMRYKLTAFDTDGRESALSNEVIINRTPSSPIIQCN